MHRAYQYRFYPTDEQKGMLARTFGCVRFVYNTILHFRTDAFRSEGVKIGFTEANAQLSLMKQDESVAWLREVSCVPLQQCLRHQQRAFVNFFQGRAHYPRFKSKHDHQSAEFTRSAFTWRGGQLTLAKDTVPLDIRWSRALPSEPSTITISKDAAERYFVSCLCKFEVKPLLVVPKTVGIDVGLTHLAVLSTGEKIDNPKHTARHAKKLAKLQRKLARCEKGSANRKKWKKKVARQHGRIADARHDMLHKLTRRLIDENQVVCVESLSVKNMIKNRHLAKAISDASWGELVRQLEYKGKWAGRTVVKIDRFFPSSKRCSAPGCGHVLKRLPLEVREWTCPACGARHDRDVNASTNIEAAGLAVLASGGSGRPESANADAGGPL